MGRICSRAGVVGDRDGNVLTGARSVKGRWKEYFEELMDEENEREQKVEEVTIVDQEVENICMAEVRWALKRMKSGKQVALMIYLWRCGSV